MDDVKDFFNEVRARIRARKPQIREAEPPQPQEILARTMSELAQNRTLNDQFLPWLLKVESRAHRLADEMHSNHAETSYWLGYSAALRSLRECFDAWRDNRPPAPQKGPTNE